LPEPATEQLNVRPSEFVRLTNRIRYIAWRGTRAEMCLGTHPAWILTAPKRQQVELINAVAALGKPTVAVVSMGGAVPTRSLP
jgi:hypothetical protein